MKEGNCYRVTVKDGYSLAYVIAADNREEAQEKALTIRHETAPGGEVTRIRELHPARTHAQEGARARRRAA